jgi:hypothetical protein
MDINRVDLLIKYIFAAAGQEDYAYREVRPIHLVKYVYCADLAFAEKHGGEIAEDGCSCRTSIPLVANY